MPVKNLQLHQQDSKGFLDQLDKQQRYHIDFISPEEEEDLTEDEIKIQEEEDDLLKGFINPFGNYKIPNESKISKKKSYQEFNKNYNEERRATFNPNAQSSANKQNQGTSDRSSKSSLLK